jgi:amino acid adenylation domain-containing protein/non-ribosomal peptide synthase protein (TIGR01720 family)
MSKQLNTNGLEVAIVGMSLRLPHCETVESFWRNLCKGEELIKFYDDEELLAKGVCPKQLSQSNYIKAGGFIDKPFQFDADFFNYVPREAQYMDPQLRLLHEVSWQALQDAESMPKQTEGDIGLYCGSAQNIKWLNLLAEQVDENSGETYELQMLCKREFFNTRLAYNMNLTGPAISVDSTCSTSLVAIHLAAQGLLSGDCDVALAGGVCVSPAVKGYSYHEGMIQSPDGHCRSFDAEAKGTVPGNGLGMVALKRLDDAIEDGNHIYAVIKGSAINNDGHAKPGYTSPSVKGQKRVIEKALEIADIAADEIDFVECHGTATTIGDPIEVEALTQAFQQQHQDESDVDNGDSNPCYIGSVKSNVGHLDAAAGVIGFIKATLSLQNNRLPPTLHYKKTNENINFSRSNLVVNDTLRSLENTQRPLRGGVSSFGIGGTNAHVLLEEYVEQRHFHYDNRRWEMLPFSSKSTLAADAYSDLLADYLIENTHPLADIANSLQKRDGEFTHRHVLLANNHKSAAKQLEQRLGGRFYAEESAIRPPSLAFMFAGQGGQYLKMSADLYHHESAYRELVEQCFDCMAEPLSKTLRALLLGTNSPEEQESSETLLAQTENTQPLLFIIEYALASHLIDLGLEPDVMVGHSVGEYVAACIAGVFDLEDALALVVARGQLMASAEVGAMLSVSAGVEQVEDLLSDELELAASNAPELIVLSGTTAAVDAAILLLTERDIKCSKLRTSHGYHSHMMDGILDAFHQRCAQVSMQEPTRPFYSNVSGQLITCEQATSANYWVAHLRGTVNFTSAIDDILAQGPTLLLEVGPGNSLSTFVRYNNNFNETSTVINTLRHPKEPIEDDLLFVQCLAKMYCQGFNLDWTAYNRSRQCRPLTVPAYTFEQRDFDQIGGQPQLENATDNHVNGTSISQSTSKAMVISHPRPALSCEMVEPRNEKEVQQAEFWRKMFTLDKVGVNDNFFELGGHSLLATRVLSQIKSELNVQLKISDVFEKPTIAELVSFALTQTHDETGIPNITLISRDEAIPASFQQRRLWLIDQIEGDSWQYNMPSSLVVRGQLNLEALQLAVDLLVARHESLRTNFSDIEGEPHLIINPARSVNIVYQDISDLAEEQRQIQMQALSDADAMTAFDLTRDLMLRLSIVRLADSEHLLLFNVHHIASDGWSEIIMIKEFGAAYSAYCDGSADKNVLPVLPELAVQYPDFAAWQRNWLSGDVLASEVNCWTEQLIDLPLIHELPLDKPRPAQQTFNGEVFRRTIKPELLAQLKRISIKEGATLFMTVQSIFALVLSRWSDQEDIVMGTPIAGRTEKSLESLIGFFVNTLVLRNDLSGKPDFHTLLKRTKAMALKAFSHQHVPFEMLVDKLISDRSPSYSPLFQILFALQSYERSSLALGDLELEKLSGKVSAKFDLTLLTAESDEEGLLADWYFNTDLFEQETIERMAEHFELLTEAICLADEQGKNDCVFNLPMLTEAEQQLVSEQTQLIQLANQQQPLRPVHRLFEQQVDKSPEMPAITCSGGSQWNYQTLNSKANQLARHMLASGVVSGARVAIAIERSEEMILAIIAVLKVGAAYVPVDPTYPQDRIDYMLNDSGASLVLTTSGLTDKINPGSAATVLVDGVKINGYSVENLTVTEVSVSIDDNAYMIYTSGSTGKPKSVVIPHQQLASSLQARLDYYQQPVRSYLLLSSISFDSSVAGIFWTLCSGGQLVVPDDSEIKDPEALLGIIEKQQVSHLLCVPSLYRYLLDTADKHSFSPLQTVILAGEALSPKIHQRHFTHNWSSGSDLFNEYGPTEGTVWSSVYQCQPSDLHDSVPIGVSPGHAGLFVLDKHQTPVPIGVNGQLYIGGSGIAKEYWQRPELSAEAFTNVLIDGQLQRLYRSGDLVRWNKDRQLVFVGRADHQVKINGYRIETDEVQSCLETHTQIKQALVLAKDERLVAYYQREQTTDGLLPELNLKSHCLALLPGFAVPTVWLELADFPLTSNGKVDRNKLPAPSNETVHKINSALLEAPLGELSSSAKHLLSVWSQLLGQKAISVDDNFFRLGGDSILVLKLKALLLNEGYSFNVPSFYKEPTIATLERLIEVKSQRVNQEDIVGEQTLMPAQHWFFALEDSNLEHFNQAVMLTSTETLKGDLFKSTIRALVQRHDVLRLTFEQVEVDWQGRYQPMNEHLLEQMVLIDEVADSPNIEQLAEQYQASLDLKGPLFKAVLMQVADGSSRILLIAHHLLIDGVSWRIVMSDLMMAYGQAQSGQQVKLSEKSTSLQSWANALKQSSNRQNVTGEAAYWQSELAKQTTAIDYRHAGSNLVADQKSVSVSFNTELTQQLLTETRRAYNMGIEEVLLAGLSEALFRWQGLTQVRLMLENHGRDLTLDELDVNATIGWFTALYPLHLSREPGLHGQLNAIKQQVRKVPAKGANFGVLRYHTDLLPQANQCDQGDLLVFNYLGQFDESMGQESLFGIAQEKAGALVSDARQRDSLISFDGLISQGQLKFTVRFSEQQLSQQSMEQLGTYFEEAVEGLVAHCHNTVECQYAPVDFPDVSLSDKTLALIKSVPQRLLDVYPATPTQQGMAFHTLLAQDSDDNAYTNQIYFDLQGDLSVEDFASAWRKLVADNDIFRTALVRLEDSSFAQALYDQSDFEFSYFSRDSKSAAQVNTAFEQYKTQDRQRGFDLKQPCLMRVSVWQLTKDSYRILWTNHHTVMDGWSIPLVFNDVLCHYHNDGIKQRSVPSRASFKSYIHWLGDQDKVEALDFWQNELATVNRGCLLPGDLSRQSSQESDKSVGEFQRALSEEDNEATFNLAQSLGVTPASLVQAAWGYLLSQYTGDEQVVFGTTVAGRPAELKGSDQIIGSFINTVPVVLAYNRDLTLGEFLEEVHSSHAERDSNGYLPLSQLKQLSGIPHSEEAFNTLVVFENYPQEGIRAQKNKTGGLSAGAICSEESTGYDLTLVVMPGDTLRFKLLYRTSLFSQARIEQYLHALENIFLNYADALDSLLVDVQLLDSPKQANSLEPLSSEEEITQFLEMVDEDELARLLA